MSALIAAVLLTMLGAHFGYASAEHYGGILRRSVLLTATAMVLVAVAIYLGPKCVRVSGAVLLVIVLLAAVDPVTRLAYVGWRSP